MDNEQPLKPLFYNNEPDPYIEALQYYGEFGTFKGCETSKSATELATIQKGWSDGLYRIKDGVVEIKVKHKIKTPTTSLGSEILIENYGDLIEATDGKISHETNVVEVWKELVSVGKAREIILQLHQDCFHGSRSETRKRIAASKFYRVGIFQQVNKFFAGDGQCPLCAKHKKRKDPEELTPILSSHPFERIVGDYTFPRGREDYCLATFVDHFTKKAWVFVSQRKTQISIVNCLQAICDEVGTFPIYFQTDNGAEFGAKVEEFCTKNGIKQVKSRPYHPRTNGAVERFNQTIKDEIWKQLDVNEMDYTLWKVVVTKALEIYNNRTHATIKMSPNEAWKKSFIIDFKSATVEELAKVGGVLHSIKTDMQKRANYDAKRKSKKSKIDIIVGSVVWIDLPDKKRGRNEDNIPQNKRKLAQVVERSTNHQFRVRWLSMGAAGGKFKQGAVHRFFFKKSDATLVAVDGLTHNVITQEIGEPYSSWMEKHPLETSTEEIGDQNADARIEVQNPPENVFSVGDDVFFQHQMVMVGFGVIVSIHDQTSIVKLVCNFCPMLENDLQHYSPNDLVPWPNNLLVPRISSKDQPKPSTITPPSFPPPTMVDDGGELDEQKEWDANIGIEPEKPKEVETPKEAQKPPPVRQRKKRTKIYYD